MGILRWFKKKRIPAPRPRPEPLGVPPWEEYQWVGEVKLPEWAGFQERLGAYTGLSSDGTSDGTVLLFVYVKEEVPAPPTPGQIAAFNYLLANGERIRDAILAKTLTEYRKWDSRSFEGKLEKLERPEQLKSMIGPGNVYILITEEDGSSHIGFEFGCSWDEEQGLGAITHKDRVLQVGDAEIAWAEGWTEAYLEEGYLLWNPKRGAWVIRASIRCTTKSLWTESGSASTSMGRCSLAALIT